MFLAYRWQVVNRNVDIAVNDWVKFSFMRLFDMLACKLGGSLIQQGHHELSRGDCVDLVLFVYYVDLRSSYVFVANLLLLLEGPL